MITAGVLLAALLFLLVLTLLSILEMSLSRTNKVSMRRMVEKLSPESAGQIRQLMDSRLESQVDIYVGIQVCSASIAIVLTGYLHSQFDSYLATLPAALGLMFLVVVIFRQLIPRICTFHKPERAVLTLLPSYRLLRPFLKVLAYPLASSLRLFRRFNAPEVEEEKTEQHTEEEIQAFIDVGQEEGILKKGEEDLIQSVVEFGETVTGDIMVPRTHMVTINVNATPEMLKQLITSTKHSRVPVYRDHVENIEGFVYLKDLIDIWDTPVTHDNLESLVRPIQFVPETKRVAELLAELQRQSSHMAIVVDEHGGVAGLVTIEDILEEIAGEIHDEDEVAENSPLARDANGSYLIPGNTAIEEVEDLFHIRLHSEETTTVAGFLTSVFGRVPLTGEKYDTQGVRFEVQEADHRRISKLRARQTVPPQLGR
ncbi:MAG: HlyC/CorC family transporter [Acidobacteria bacterium]|nr:HlyC/CorC family transporter [Acidobacteriota bacterium]